MANQIEISNYQLGITDTIALTLMKDENQAKMHLLAFVLMRKVTNKM